MAWSNKELSEKGAPRGVQAATGGPQPKSLKPAKVKIPFKELRTPRSSEPEKNGYLPKKLDTPKPAKVVKVAKAGVRSATKLRQAKSGADKAIAAIRKTSR